MLRSRVFPFILLLLLLFAGACDSGGSGSDTIFITQEISSDANGDPLRFIFSSSDLETGRLQDVDCNCQIDVGPFLEAQAFTKNDVESALLQSARLVMLFPINEQLDFLGNAILKIDTGGVSPTEIANQSGLPNTRESSMQVLPNRNISGYVETSDFKLILQIDPTSLQPDKTYEIGIVLTLRYEVSGI